MADVLIRGRLVEEFELHQTPCFSMDAQEHVLPSIFQDGDCWIVVRFGNSFGVCPEPGAIGDCGGGFCCGE